jgi:hypothetical protein
MMAATLAAKCCLSGKFEAEYRGWRRSDTMAWAKDALEPEKYANKTLAAQHYLLAHAT